MNPKYSFTPDPGKTEQSPHYWFYVDQLSTLQLQPSKFEISQTRPIVNNSCKQTHPRPLTTSRFSTRDSASTAMLKALRISTTLNSQFLASRSVASSLTPGVRTQAARSYATEAALPSSSTSANVVASVGRGKKGEAPEGPLRPQLGVEVNPNHGLWAFFRKKVGKDGVSDYETLEAKDGAVDYSGMFPFVARVPASVFFVPCFCTDLQLVLHHLFLP